ncbi:hypothetical protein M407DRAFT_112278 [Tulasnella calospora MUT 4182]|uniref:Alpha-ketoglutarate-dependent dioxygenase AlkB-like domain-containing protein n=1 Tax=Tulasnella calospora MUT 4182 TaxID=1051891 RepID=A0A0C3QUU5_9AGAM|nr:hypothetical protein M407DRAFT_112278 [Tulasnella calospora MUT 4182]
MLGSQFVMNSGMPYHYVSEATTVSLEDSPPCVAQALELINHKAALVQDPSLDEMPFNEALSICYLEGQRMNYHSDAEPGLGDVVASLSLGNPASMDFRLYSGAWRGTRELSIELRHVKFLGIQSVKPFLTPTNREMSSLCKGAASRSFTSTKLPRSVFALG